MNPCIPGTYNFLEIVVGEIAAMHHQINKDLHNHFHIGYVNQAKILEMSVETKHIIFFEVAMK